MPLKRRQIARSNVTSRSHTSPLRSSRRLRAADNGSASWVRHSQQRAIDQFQRAAASVPFYERLLTERGVRPAHVANLETFQAIVPIITKRDVFTAHPLADLLVDGALDDIATLISSSGLTASSFSLGMINRQGTQSMIESTDRMLDDLFGTGKKKTFVINTCAMGVTIPTALPGINLSVRSDKVMAMLQALKAYYRQFLVTSDVYFLKKILEDGRNAGLRWSEWPVQFAIGGEWFPESYRRYLASILGVDLDQPRPPIRILSSMGAAELGFNLCVETHDTVRLRGLAVSDTRLRQALFGPVDTVPMIGHYDPRRWFIEVVSTPDDRSDAGSFVFTNLDPDAAMPLVRYQTGDCGYVLSRRRVSNILRMMGYDGYVPRSTAPLVAVAGRTDQSLRVGDKSVRMEFLRDVLYSNRALAAVTTGQFKMREQRGRLHLHIQLQADVASSRRMSIQSKFAALFNRHVATVVRAMGYYEFRDALSVDYERKFDHKVREA